MITQWDIISSISPQSGAILYSLLIDGTEHDARLIAKKLQGYAQDPQPALAPYVYRFSLPEDLDEDTLEKIRLAVREGIEQAKKVNEFIPGGSLGNPLFTEEITQEDKNFPTFITLDPSESFFQSTEHSEKDRALPELEEEKEEDVLTSIENDEPAWQEPAPVAEVEGLEIQVQAVQADQIPQELSNQTAEEVVAKQPIAEEMPLSDKDMFNKDMEGTLLDPALEDILSAETKYDMFLDLGPIKTQETAAKVVPPPAISEPVASTATQEPVPESPKEEEKEEGFNIFDQKIKDQTCFVDLDDVKIVTERITQKDLSFLQHAQVKPVAEKEETPSFLPEAEKKNNFSSPADPQEDEQVLDPFEQLLATAASSAQQPEPAPAEINLTPQSEEKDPPPAQPEAESFSEEQQGEPLLPPVPPQEAVVSTPQEPLPLPEENSGVTEEEHRVIPPPPAMSIMEKKMSENTGDKKPILRLKRKVQEPAAPAAPVPPPAPQPVAPAAPAPTAPAPTAPAAPIVQEEKQHTILRRRRPAANTVFEKTRTIDHSIELPLSELKKHNWPLEVPLIPTYTLENMTISINRFAHATAISVIENPGKLYNPLVLHGDGGTGKTHFLHAIGYALSKKYGQENIFITNGVRLSRGIQRYVMEGNIDKFEKFVSSVKALLIDDIHLIAVNEQNRVYLSKLLNDFRTQHKQIVMTSKYPPESLAKLEELLNFKLDSGWISELKGASDPARTRIIQKMLLSNNINISDDAINRFFSKENMSLGTVNRAIRRVKVLERLIFPQLAVEERSSANLFDQLLATGGEDQKSLVWQKSVEEITSSSVIGNGEWGRIGFFYPQNNSNMMNWLVFALQQRAKELGISGGPELAVRSSYSTDNIISSAFKIANLCDNKKLKGAVILGPELGICDPSVRENFYDILTHMLEIMLIRCGVINYESANAPSTYVKILSELLR